MYVVRDKKSKMIIFVSPTPVNDQLTDLEVYPDFDSKTMEIGKTDSDEILQHFNIDKKGNIVPLTSSQQIKAGLVDLASTQKVVRNKIVEKTLKEQVSEGLIVLASTQKVVRNKIVEKTLKEQVKDGLISVNEPFEHIVGDSIRQRDVKDLVKGNLLTTVEQCDEALTIIKNTIEEQIMERYRPGDELKLVKTYLSWLSDDKPADDPREKAYLEMEEYINQVKADLEDTKNKVKQIKVDLEAKK